MRIVITVLAAALVAAAAVAARAPVSAPQAADAGGWRSFEGTFSASGQHQAIPTESGRPAVTVQLSGAVAITAGEGLGRGFRGEVIGFDDGSGVTVLRGVWTDGHGDRIFSQLKGETVATGRRIAATISGGTGRYAGITGDYSFEWQYVIEAEAGTVQGRAIGLRGRYRAAGAGK
jgi:opacity protein-like surface antigen